MAELDAVLAKLKTGTAAGYDNLFPEFLLHLGPGSKRWFTQFLSRVLLESSLPRFWRQAKVIALLKPGKDPTLPASYRPIALLNVSLKTLERLILHRINPHVERCCHQLRQVSVKDAAPAIR